MPPDFLKANESGIVSASGDVASRLLANGLNLNALRTNATLRKEEWLEFDTAIIEEARDRLVLVADLVNAGLTFPLKNAMGTTVVQWETQDTMRPAEVNMDGVTRAAADRPNFEQVSVPVPITHYNFQFNIRQLAASRLLGNSLDVTSAIEATEQVAIALEDMVMNGVGISFGGSSIFGYTNHPDRNLVDLPAPWDSSGIGGELIVADVLSMIAAARVDNMRGPYMLYVPDNYWLRLIDDYKISTSSDRTTLERIQAIPNIMGVKSVDRLTADNVLLVQMTKNVVDMVIGQQPTMLEWTGEGGLQSFFKIMAIMVPRIKSSQSGQSGIVHMS